MLPDIKPQTPIKKLNRDAFSGLDKAFDIDDVCKLVGMSPTFVKKVIGSKKTVSANDLLTLLDLDSFEETYVPRSEILGYLLNKSVSLPTSPNFTKPFRLHEGHAVNLIQSLPNNSIQCVVTSTPYWGLRIYQESTNVKWADGEVCPFGHEQTPEAFVRHTAEVLNALHRVLAEDGSIWWNVMDSFNTRTQIRNNAVEALKAMQGHDKRSWSEHDCRRYSAGHSYLKDGEQCMIPAMIAERASRMGFYVKSVITWAKTSSLPEPQQSRVSRNLEYVLHLTKTRTPKFNKSAYLELPSTLGGKNNGWETDKLSDVWNLPTSSGRDGHGAQFPIALPARCIALSTAPDDYVLDPFVGAGNSGVAAMRLGRNFIGIDVSKQYLETATRKINDAI